MNNIVGPIFNEKVDEKWSVWVSWTVHGSTDMTENELKSQIMWLLYINSRRTISLNNGLKKKKKKKEEGTNVDAAK